MADAIGTNAQRFARQMVLPGFGESAQSRLAAARVVVLGAGGIGSAVIPALAGAGVGTLVLVDDDRVETSNLHRQTLHGVADVGRLKVDSAADAIAAIAPDVHVERRAARFDTANAADLLAGADLLVDGSDNATTRFAANDAAAVAGIPLVWGSALRYGAQVGVASERQGIDYRDLFPDHPDEELTCEIAGVLPTVCAVAGALMATEAIKLLTGIGEPLFGRVAVFDALSGRTREIAYARDAVERARRVQSSASASTPSTPAGAADALDPAELASLLANRELVLLDVREPWEAEIAALPGAVLIPLHELPARIGELSRESEIVAYCHHGVRSERARLLLVEAGFSDVRNLSGGIDRWARTLDARMARY